MPATYEKVSGGDPLEIGADTWNGLLEAGQAYARTKNGREGAPARGEPLNPAVRVLVKNTTGAAIPVHSVLALGTPIKSVVDYPRENSFAPMFPGTAPAAVTDQFAVTLEPLDIDEVGRAVLMGVVSCSVNIQTSTDTYATPKVGDSTQLDSATTGPAFIVWRESGSSGTKKALVTLTPAAPASGFHEAVRVATTTSGTLSTDFANGSTVDGVTLATGDRVLLKDQSSGAENGIRIVRSSGAPSRALDADTGSELIGANVWVSEGTTNADTIWACTTNAPITIDSTSTGWIKIYPQSFVSSWKESVRGCNTVAGTFSTSYANGQAMDGITLATGDRILLRFNTTANGIYVVQSSGSPVRAEDADTGSELLGAVVYVREGTTNGNTVWIQTTSGTITLGTTNMVWKEHFPDATASVRGVVSTGAQTFAGAKTFQDAIYVGSGPPTTSMTPTFYVDTTGQAVFTDQIFFFSAPIDVTNYPDVAYTHITTNNITLRQRAGGVNYDVTLNNYQGGGAAPGGLGAFSVSVPDNSLFWVSSPTGAPAGYAIGTTAGITASKTVKDGTGTNQTVTITGGIITGWT